MTVQRKLYLLVVIVGLIVTACAPAPQAIATPNATAIPVATAVPGNG